MKCRVIKSNVFLIKRYVPQWWDEIDNCWKNWGVWYDGVQMIIRFWTRQPALDFIKENGESKIRPVEMLFINKSKKVWHRGTDE